MKVFLIEKLDPIISILWSILIYSTCQTKINWESWFMIFKCAWRLLDNSFPNTVIVWHESQSCLTLCDRGILQVKHSSGQPFPSPGDLPKPGIELRSPTLLADSLASQPPGKLAGYEISKKNGIYRCDQAFTDFSSFCTI